MAIIKRQYRKKKQQKPVIYYQAEVFVKGVRVTVRNFSTKREAVLWHEEQKYQFTLNPANYNNRMRFKDCVDKFWEDAKTRMAPSSIQNYETQFAYFYSGPLAQVKMFEFKGYHVVEWISWLKKHPTAKRAIRKSFVKNLNLLKTVLNWYKNFLNEDFNVPVTKKHRQMCFFKPNAPRQPDYYIQPEDAHQWVKWLKARRSNPVYWKLAVFMLSTGARVGEACGMKWGEVELERKFVRIVRRVRWDHFNKKPFLEDVTKTAGSARLLMLPKRLQSILKAMKKEAVNDLVFTDKNGGLLKYNAVQSAFNAGFTALKLPWRSTHICRHTYATVALMATKNLSAVQASLGHTEQRTTQKYAKTVALLSPETGEKTFSALFKNSRF